MGEGEDEREDVDKMGEGEDEAGDEGGDDSESGEEGRLWTVEREMELSDLVALLSRESVCSASPSSLLLSTTEEVEELSEVEIWELSVLNELEGEGLSEGEDDGDKERLLLPEVGLLVPEAELVSVDVGEDEIRDGSGRVGREELSDLAKPR